VTPDSAPRGKGAAFGGVFMIVVTALLALTQVGVHDGDPAGALLIFAIGLLVAGGAWVLARLIARRGKPRRGPPNRDDGQP